MKTEITKEVFFQFLKDNNFYNEWVEGYNLDNEIYQDEVPLDYFFNISSSKAAWLTHGIGELAFIPSEEVIKYFSSELIERWKNGENEIFQNV